MNFWIKLAAGVISGAVVMYAFGGFKKDQSDQQKPNPTPPPNNEPYYEDPDDIFSERDRLYRQRQQEIQAQQNNLPSNNIRQATEQNIRDLQNGLGRASDILGHICNICRSIVGIFTKSTPNRYEGYNRFNYNNLGGSPTTIFV